MWAAQVLGLTAASSSRPSDGHSDSLEMFRTTSQAAQLWWCQNSCWTLRGSWIKKNVLGWKTKGRKLTNACRASLKRNFGEMWPCDAVVNTQGHYLKCWQSCLIFQARLKVLPQGYILRCLVCFINSVWFIYLLFTCLCLAFICCLKYFFMARKDPITFFSVALHKLCCCGWKNTILS